MEDEVLTYLLYYIFENDKAVINSPKGPRSGARSISYNQTDVGTQTL